MRQIYMIDIIFVSKSRLHENSVVITLPSTNSKKSSENQEYIVVYSDGGTITLAPKLEDLFIYGEEADYYEKVYYSSSIFTYSHFLLLSTLFTL